MSSRVYIGRLSYSAREKDVERFFRRYGNIREINLKNGFGFVEFDDSRDAEDAVYYLNGKELCGDKVIIEHARGPARGRDDRYGRSFERDRRPGWIDKYGPPVRTDYRVVVEHLSSRVSWQDLKDYMRQAGEVTFADAHKQRKNEGIVEFATWSDMHNAIKKLDGTELNGRTIKIYEDSQHKRSRRDYSHSRSRSRSRSRSQRRSRSPRSRSRSPRRARRSRSASHSRSRSRSPSKSRSRSRSKTPRRSQSKSPRASPRKSLSRSRSRSGSRSKSRSMSPKD